MVIFENRALIAKTLATLRQNERKTAFLSIMGLLHEGHIAMIRKAREMGDAVMVMVFANPMLVTDADVLAAFEKGHDSDKEKLEAEGVDYAFFASSEDIFPSAHRTFVQPERLLKQFHGIESEGYIRGLTTALFQMINLFRPDFFVVGQKNFLDGLLLKRIVRDYAYYTEVVLTPCVRDETGMAYSVFNRFYTAEERQAAIGLADALMECRKMVLAGETSVKNILTFLTGRLSGIPLLQVLYAGVMDPVTAVPLEKIQNDALVLLTARIGRFRVTDNFLFRRRMD